jgi:hypothetical protein
MKKLRTASPRTYKQSFRALLLAISIATFAGSVLFTSGSAYAQARPSPAENVISLDPLELALLGPLNVQYEWKSGPVNSWALRGHFWGRTGWTGFGLGGAYRFYIADSRALTGLSVAPAADIFFFSNSELGYSATDLLIGGDLGYKWIFTQFSVEPIVTFRIGIGLGSSISNFTYATGAVVGIGIYLGYAW